MLLEGTVIRKDTESPAPVRRAPPIPVKVPGSTSRFLSIVAAPYRAKKTIVVEQTNSFSYSQRRLFGLVHDSLQMRQKATAFDGVAILTRHARSARTLSSDGVADRGGRRAQRATASVWASFRRVSIEAVEARLRIDDMKRQLGERNATLPCTYRIDVQ